MGDRAGLDCGCADGLIADPAEQFAKARDFFAVECGERFGRDIAAGHPCAPGDEDAGDGLVIDPVVQLRDNRAAIIGHERAVGEFMAKRGDAFG